MPSSPSPNTKSRNKLASTVRNLYNLPPVSPISPGLPPVNFQMNEQGLFPDVGSAIDQFAQRYISPIGKFTKSFIEPVDRETGLPNVDVAGPVLSGVRGAENARMILDKILESKPMNIAEAAVDFIKAKYPKRSAIPEFFDSVMDMPNSLYGAYDPKIDIAGVNALSPQDLRNATNTASHELEHAYQYKNKGRTAELEGPQDGGNYYSPHLPENFTNIIKDAELRKLLAQHQFKMYQNQPVEVEARNAGEIAAKAFDKFKTFFPVEERTFDLNQPLNRELWDSGIKQALKHQLNENIYKAEDLQQARGHQTVFNENNIKMEDYLRKMESGNVEPIPAGGLLPLRSLTPILRRLGYTHHTGIYPGAEAQQIADPFERVLGLIGK